MASFNDSPQLFKPYDVIGPGQKELLGKILNRFKNTLGTGLFGHGLDIPTERSPIQSLSLAGLENLALGDVGGGGTSGNAAAAVNDILTRGPTDLSDFIETNIVNPTVEDVEDRILPLLRNSATSRGVRFSQGQAEREERLAGDIAERVGRARAAASLEGRRADDATALNAALASVGLRGADVQEFGAELDRLLAQFEAGDIDRQISNDLIRFIIQLSTTPTVSAGPQGTSIPYNFGNSLLSSFGQSYGSSLGTSFGQGTGALLGIGG